MVCSSKVISTCALVLVYSVKQAIGDVIVVPALGIANGGVDVTEKDVQPFIGFDTPCGTIDVAKNLDTSTAVPANADGTFNITGVSFAVGVDGSTAVTAAVDTTGAGNKFSAGLQIQQNGNPVQAIAGTQQSLVGVLPPNTTCTGGQTKDLCLVQFMTAGGFSNCVVVSQGNGNNNNNNNNNNTNVDNGNNNNNNTNVDNNNNNNNNTNVDNGNNNNNNNTNVDNNNKNNNTNVDNGNNKNNNKNSNSNSGSKNVGSASKASSKDNSKGKSGMASAASSKSNSGAAKIGSAGMKGEAASKSAGAKVVPPPPAAGPGKGAEAAKPAKVGKPVAPKSRLSRIVI